MEPHPASAKVNILGITPAPTEVSFSLVKYAGLSFWIWD